MKTVSKYDRKPIQVCRNTQMYWVHYKNGTRWNINMITSYYHRKSPSGDKAILRSAYIHNGISYAANHDDVIKWKHFPRYWPFVRRIHRSPVNSLHKGQWRGALMFSLICTWINSWVNHPETGDLRCHRAHCDVSVMHFIIIMNWRPGVIAYEFTFWPVSRMIIFTNVVYLRLVDG